MDDLGRISTKTLILGEGDAFVGGEGRFVVLDGVESKLRRRRSGRDVA